MRSYIRHPSDIPIEVMLEDVVADENEYLNDISHGGLSFNSRLNLEIGTIVRLRIPMIKPVFEARGKVVWCHRAQQSFVVGVEFVDDVDKFKIRMVEQICHIEHYKKEVQEKEGRVLSGQEAAMEWIKKFAQDFPPADDDQDN